MTYQHPKRSHGGTTPAYTKKPDYTKYQEKESLPSFGWMGEEKIVFRVEYIIWPHEGQGTDTNDWAIAIVNVLRDEKHLLISRRESDWKIVAVGGIPGAAPGKLYTGIASLRFNEKFGTPNRYTGQTPNYSEWQLSVSMVMESAPLTIHDIERFLCSLPHIGPVRARQLTNVHGLDTLTVIREEGVGAFDHVPGLTEEQLTTGTLPRFRETFDSIIQSKLLGGANISGAARNRALNRYRGKDIRTVMRGTPTDILEIEGISFAQALALWLLCDLAKDDMRIISAAIAYVLRQHEQRGDTWTDLTSVFEGGSRISGVQSLLSLPNLKNRWFTEHLISSDEIAHLVYVDRHGGMWRRRTWDAEQRFAEALARLLAAGPILSPAQVLRARTIIDRLIADKIIIMSPRQKEVALEAFRYSVVLITGPAGTGKTTIQKAIAIVAAELGVQPIQVVAPTGKAADNATIKVGLRATTIHKAIELTPNGVPVRNSDNPLEARMLIIDEISMVDILLAANFVEALRVGGHVVMVGDPEQLPAVGPGAVLRDMIDCQVIPRFHLTETFRQDPNSNLLDLFAAVLAQRPIALIDQDGASLYPDIQIRDFTGPHANQRMVEWAVQKFGEVRDPNRMKFLAYTRGKKQEAPGQKLHMSEKPQKIFMDASVGHLNEEIVSSQSPLLTGEEVYKTGDKVYRAGQRCLWLTNTNDETFDMTNGREFDITRIWRDKETDAIWMEITCRNAYGQPIMYEFQATLWDGDFMHGYCLTIHKGQGSEYDEVCFFLRAGDEYRLDREAVYTALTRAKKTLYIVGDVDVIWMVQPSTPYRKTGLVQKLKACITPTAKNATAAD